MYRFVWVKKGKLIIYQQGYALIEFETLDEAKRAVEETNDTKFMDQTITVDFAFVRPPPGGTPSNNASGGGGGGRGRRSTGGGVNSRRQRSTSPGEDEDRDRDGRDDEAL